MKLLTHDHLLAPYGKNVVTVWLCVLCVLCGSKHPPLSHHLLYTSTFLAYNLISKLSSLTFPCEARAAGYTANQTSTNPVNPVNPVKEPPRLRPSVISALSAAGPAAQIAAAAQAVLDARARYPGASLADLYDPLTMPLDAEKTK